MLYKTFLAKTSNKIKAALILFVISLLLANVAFSPVIQAAALPKTAEQYVDMQRGDIEGRSFTGDGGAAVRTKNGTFLSFYGDSFVFPSSPANPRYPKAATQQPYMMRNNVIIITPTGHVKSAVSTDNLLAKKSFLDVPVAEQKPGGLNYYWFAAAAVQYGGQGAGNTIAVTMWHMFSPTGSTDVWGYQKVGTKIAIYKLDSSYNLVLQRLQDTPDKLVPADPMDWGAGVRYENGYLYVYGSHKPAGDFIWGHDYYISRVPVKSSHNLNAWRYWNGSSWVADRSAAAIIFPNSAGAEGSIMIAKDSQTGMYTFVFKQFAFIGSKIIRVNSPKLEGNWVMSDTPAAELPPYSDNDYTYCGVEVPLAGGRRGLIVSHGNAKPWPAMSEIGIRSVSWRAPL